MMTPEERIKAALEIATKGGADGTPHKMWVIDQMVRALTDCPIVKKTALDYKGQSYQYDAYGESQEYLSWVEEFQADENGDPVYEWDIGIAP